MFAQQEFETFERSGFCFVFLWWVVFIWSEELTEHTRTRETKRHEGRSSW